MNNFLKYSFLIKIIYLFITSLLFINSIGSYIGNKYFYFFFTISISIFFLTSFNKKQVKFFEFFLSIFFWLGFFFKFYVCNKIIKTFPEGVGSFDFKPKSFDEVMLISSVGIWGFILGYYLVPKKILKININLKFMEDCYNKNRKVVIYGSLIFIIFISLLNFNFGFFQKGFVSNHFLGSFFRNFIAYLLMIGFGSIIAFIINFELNRKNYNIIYLPVFETFFTSLSMLSRAMIFNFFPFLIGYLLKINNFKFIKFNLSKTIIFCLIFLVLFIFSVIATSNMRFNKNIYKTENNKLISNLSYINYDIKQKENISYKNLINFRNVANIEESKNLKSAYFSETMRFYDLLFNIITYRFVGIEGVMAVQAKKNKNINLYITSLREKYKENHASFYDRTFLSDTSSYVESLEKIENQHAITLPGFIAHSFYSGSYIFVFFLAVLMSFFCNFMLVIIQSTFGNLIFNSFIANILSYRVVHWGFAPLNSYKLILGITLFILTLIFLNYAIKKLYFRK